MKSLIISGKHYYVYAGYSPIHLGILNISLCLVTMQCKDALGKILQKLQIPDLFDSVIY